MQTFGKCKLRMWPLAVAIDFEPTPGSVSIISVACDLLLVPPMTPSDSVAEPGRAHTAHSHLEANQSIDASASIPTKNGVSVGVVNRSRTPSHSIYGLIDFNKTLLCQADRTQTRHRQTAPAHRTANTVANLPPSQFRISSRTIPIRYESIELLTA